MELTTTENRMSVAVAKTKMQLALTTAQTNIQALHDAESSLVYNEDNLQQISDFINKVKKAESVIETKRKELKEPALQEGKNIDEGAKVISSELQAIRTKAAENYNKLCVELESRHKQAEIAKQRVFNIQEGIKNNILAFSTEISNCSTNAQLIHVERKINLEKGRKDKYAEFIDDFIEKSKPLTVLLTEQKQKIKDYEAVTQELSKAMEAQDDAKSLELMDKKEVLEAKIAENSQNVANEALNMAINAPTVAEQILPEAPKAKRSVWKFRVVDLKETEKKMKDWIVKSIDENKVKLYLDTKKAEGIDKNTEEFTFAGVKFYLERSY